MDSAPMMGSRPIKLYEPDGKAYWAIHHLGAWRQVEGYRDPHTGAWATRIKSGSPLVANPVVWTSS
jgi:hypothetical protein